MKNEKDKKGTEKAVCDVKKNTSTYEQSESDLPIEHSCQDAFEMNSYVESLSEFINECRTPMTIAIQGAWGTGKTSLMQLVKEELEKEELENEGETPKDDKRKGVVVHIFNTWQYSQFDKEDNTAASFLNCFLNSLHALKPDQQTSENEEQGTKIDSPVLTQSDSETGKNIINDAFHNKKKTIKSGAYNLLRIGVDKVAGSEALRQLDAFVKHIIEDNNALGASELKGVINEAVRKSLEQDNKDRYVFFIDDLDRLSPEKAVEVLEVIKVFLDCEKCVFVLAIDYKVIANGIRAKYGDYIDENKARDFFDKIIQLPFRMPVSAYKINGYVKSLLVNADKKLKEEFHSEEDIDKRINELSDIIDKTIGKNPRSIKRLINSFGLTLKVAEKNSWLKRERHYNILFLFHCIQLSWEEIYDYILINGEDFCGNPGAFCEKFTDRENCEKELELIYPQKPETTTDESLIANIMSAFEKLKNLVQEMSKNCNEDEVITDLKLILSIVSMTAMNQKKSGVTVTVPHYYFNGKTYVSGTGDSKKMNQGWLGHDIMKKFITDVKADEATINNLRDNLKKCPEYNEENQGNIIELADQCPDTGKWNLDPVGHINEKPVYVIKYWRSENLKSLVNYIKENNKDCEIKVLRNGEEL